MQGAFKSTTTTAASFIESRSSNHKINLNLGIPVPTKKDNSMSASIKEAIKKEAEVKRYSNNDNEQNINGCSTLLNLSDTAEEGEEE